MTGNLQSLPEKLSLWATFSRSQISSLTATAIDFGVLFALTELCGVWYVPSVSIGAAVGAVTNFILNRHWSFKASHREWRDQAIKYVTISAASLLLNTFGVWWVTETHKIHYGISVVIVGVSVGFFFNFPLQKYWVFKH